MLHVHRADRADALVAALGDLLATPPADPFAGEVVGVPTRGMERWLTQSLSLRLGASAGGRRDGIVANVAFPSPRDITEQAIAAAWGIDPATDAWSRQRVLWPLLEVVDANLDQAWLGILAEHLRDSASSQDADGPRPQRLVAVRHLAHLFDRYATHRAAMLARWAAGEDVDGSGRPLPRHTAWQAELWRRLRERIPGPDPAERLDGASTRIAQDPTLMNLPDRLALFGLTRLPAAHLQLLRSIAATRDVHLFLLHPSPQLWSRIAATTPPDSSVRRAEDPTATTARNRLLGSWGRDARELQLVLGPVTADADHPHATPDACAPPTTLLQRLQADVREDRHAPGPPLPGAVDARPALAADDRSVEVHSCHGRARQVEVLRDAILHVLRERPDLQPRDVIVMCPDIETFAPLIHATFGVGDVTAAGDEDDLGPADDDTPDVPVPPDLRVRLADRALRQTNPVLGTIGRLLELADQRLTASQVLDLADREPVRRRLQLDDDDLARLEDWIAATGIRWGLDAGHRAPFKLARIDANTWRAGLDRVLLGVTMTEDDQRLVGGVLPFDDVESGAIDLAGRFAEFIDRLQATVDHFATPHTVADWAAELAAAADLLTATSPRDAWQRAALDRLLADLVGEARGSTSPIALPELRDLLAERLAGRPTRTNFRTGHLTFCTLAPMRSVPHPVVCLLGLDDTAFPRKAPHDGDDLIVHDPHVGDHDGRTEDRQMLLDALLAAQDKLIVTYTGNDERTNAARPPAVPVGELLDVVDRTVRTTVVDGDDRRARDAITVRHPLQPFDPRNFTPGTLTAGAPFSFDHITLQGARALTGPRAPRPPFLDSPLPALSDPVIELDQLVRFVQHPARAFLRRRLGVSLGDFSDELDDALPIDLEPLEQWAIGDRMLAARLGGQTLKATVAAEHARGALPPARLADTALRTLTDNVEAVTAAAMDLLDQTAELASLDARVLLPDGRRLSGTVAGLDGDCLQLVTYSRLGPKHRLAAWVRLLALTAAYPQRPFQAITVGRPRSGAPRRHSAAIARIGPLGEDPETRQTTALAHLSTLIDLVDGGLRERPPLACATSAAYAEAVAAGKHPITAAGKCWASTWNSPREDQDAEHVQLLGDVVPLQALLADPPRSDEHGDGWDDDQPSRFGRWSVRLWAGLLNAEEVTDR
ncbi:MAG: recC [Solirubrobacterales bacterium]|nr:recC [Solirubrobacterales bacterium]